MTKTLAAMVHEFSYDMPRIMKGKIFEKRALELRMLMRQAKRFNIDDEFLKLAVYRSTKEPARVRQLTDFAATPFPVIFIEHDWYTRVATQYALGTMDAAPKKENRRMGYLIERVGDNSLHWRAHKFMEQNQTDRDASLLFGNVDASPFMFSLAFSADGQNMGKIAKWQGETRANPDKPVELSEILWGYDGNLFAEQRREKDLAALYDLHRMADSGMEQFFLRSAIDSGKMSPEMATKAVITDLKESQGDIRFLVTVLAMINVVPVSYKHVPATGSYKRRLKNIPYMDHSVVTIAAGKRKLIRVVEEAFRQAERLRHRAHNVRGFFRTYHRGTPEERTVWVKEHVRGDATLGWVRQEWEVTTPD